MALDTKGKCPEDPQRFADELIWHIRDGLINGGDVHLRPEDLLNGLTLEIANRKVADHVSTCWEILHHMVYWQDQVVAYLAGTEDAFSNPAGPPEPDCPADKTMLDGYRERFLVGADQLWKLAADRDLSVAVPSWGDAPIYKLLQIVMQHNSYHLAQISSIRKICA